MLYVTLEGRINRTIATRLGVLQVLRCLGHLLANKDHYIRFKSYIKGFYVGEALPDLSHIVIRNTGTPCATDTVEIKLKGQTEYYRLDEIQDLFCIEDVECREHRGAELESTDA